MITPLGGAYWETLHMVCKRPSENRFQTTLGAVGKGSSSLGRPCVCRKHASEWMYAATYFIGMVVRFHIS